MRKAVYILIFIGIWSCQEPIDIGDNVPAQLVVNSNIQAESNPEVNLAVINGLGEFVQMDLSYSDVYIKTTEGEIWTLSHVIKGLEPNSFSSDNIIEAGESYELIVNSKGFKQLKSITKVPQAGSIIYDLNGAKGPNGGYLPSGNNFRFPIIIEDPKDQANYFHLIVTISDSEKEVSALSLEPVDFGLRPFPVGANTYSNSGLMFRDSNFENGSFETEIIVALEDVMRFQNPVLNVELRTVSLDYYNYFKRSLGSSTPRFPSNPNFVMADNVFGGLGFFGGYTSDIERYNLEF